MSAGSEILETTSTAAEIEALDGYGTNAQPELAGMIKLMDLSPKYIPETGKHRRSKRLVIVGDVHGMKDSLVELLEKVKFNEKHDHLVLAGDMISKGPDSRGVVDLAIHLGATCVRGNHEDRIILAHANMEAEHRDVGVPGPSEPTDKQQDMLEEESFNHGDYKDRKLAKQLGEKRIKWLKKCPVILRVGKLGDMGEVLVVHAGLAPGIKLQQQDPVLVMSMRTIKHGVPTSKRKGNVWTKAWNKFQKSLPKKERSTVIYGHDSKRGLQLKKYSMGIDTGCRKGGKLTAVVIEGGHLDHKHKLYHVKCKDER
ncbi:Ser/Thr protein phosphatase family protein-like protein [Amylocarpus encephaloides]|uniref:Ser/Thr protein phosphatase family protein-like protein n=1 Tax=Amylocarpus encephaloides TaxID=45428 RepID=A0A9P7YHM3_9HELO|nr:Ser/Thr protein phosphatase family protein-like protein [Amylocarpus encephaloides]